MIETQNHLCAHTPATPAQRRAARIADATVLAHATFGRDAIAALQGRGHADDACAELRFVLDSAWWLLSPTVRPRAVYWALGYCADMVLSKEIVVPPNMPPAVAMEQLRVALYELRATVSR